MGNPKILIVDDEPFNLDFLEQELEEMNLAIITAGNGQEALDKVNTEQPDLILLDIMMPVMDGFEVLSRLKSTALTRDIPVIIISASNDMQSVVKGIGLGAEDYLPKPFEPSLLHARISSCLEKKHLRDLEQKYLKGLEREMEIGRTIQMGFLPSELPKLEGWEIDVFFQAAREVAGDFYDAFVLADGNLICLVGDVCGKGVGSALFMALFRSLIRAAITSDCFTYSHESTKLIPAERLLQAITFTNRYIVETHGDDGMFATLFIGIIDPQSNTLSYINCGNEPPFVMRAGKILNELLPTGPVVGALEDAKFQVKEIILEKNDMLLAFTDGITDGKNSADEFFGKERLIQSIAEKSGSLPEILGLIKSALDYFVGSTDQFDDITLLGVKKT